MHKLGLCVRPREDPQEQRDYWDSDLIESIDWSDELFYPDAPPLHPTPIAGTVGPSTLPAKRLRGPAGVCNSKNPPKKCRRQINTEESEALQRLKLQREELLRDAASDPEKKRMQQLFRNRISAQISRDRKKQYAGQLEEERYELARTNEYLRRQAAALERENRQMLKILAGGNSQEPVDVYQYRDLTGRSLHQILISALGGNEEMQGLETEDLGFGEGLYRYICN